MRVLAAVILVALLVPACGPNRTPPPPASTASSISLPSYTRPPAAPTTSIPTPTTTVASTVAVTTIPVTAPVTETTAVALPALRLGDTGDYVLTLQNRLLELGYWLGEPNGEFTADTEHAVVALQKAAGLERDGIVGPLTRRALEDGDRPAATSTKGLTVEIDLERQLLLVARDGKAEHIFDTSTGRVAGTTPLGYWEIVNEIDGLRHSRLGLLYRPKYFYLGVAIHGYTSVPPTPASHGCIRVTYSAMDYIWEAALMPVGTPVWVY